MRNLFIVLAKVVGLLQIAIAVGYIEAIDRYIFFVARHGFSDTSGEAYGNMISIIMAACLYLGFAWVLFFRTNWIADRVSLPEGEMFLPEPNLLLSIGIKLLGLYVLLEAIPAFVWVLLEPKELYQKEGAAHFWIRVVPSVLRFIFGLILVLKTTKIIELISRDSKPKEIASA